jgi:uncharacterized protein (TIGR03437 family)
MDAAQTNTKKIALFLATALLLAAPIHGYAQPTLTPSATTATLGNQPCNDSQSLSLTSSDGTTAITFTVAVNYTNAANDPTSGSWVYASLTGGPSTSTSTAVAFTTGKTGATLNIGLNRTLFVASDSAEVDLTPTGPAGVSTAVIKIAVYYVQSLGCPGGGGASLTNGSITVTPGSLSLTAGLGNEQQATLTIQNNSNQTFTFAPGVSNGTVGTAPNTVTWLTVSENSTVLQANGSTPVTVTANAGQLTSTGTYTGYVTITPSQSQYGTGVQIPVTFVVSGSGSGTGTSSGTLTLNGATSNVANLTFTYTAGSQSPQTLVGIQDSAPGANSYSYQVSTTSGGNWLLANFTTSGSTYGLLASSSQASVTISMSNALTSPATGAYQGSVALTSSSGSTATINVTLYVNTTGAATGITVTPGVVFVFPSVAANSSGLESQQFSVSASAGITMETATPVGAPGSWFNMEQTSSNGNAQFFTVYANPAGLVAGLYYAAISITSGGTQAGTTTILIVLPVGQAGSGGGTTTANAAAQPTLLYFQQQEGSSYWTGGQEAQTVTITGAQGTQWGATVVYGTGAANWLNFDSPVNGTGTFGSGPASLVVDLYNGIGSLPSSSTPYTATITLSSNGTAFATVSVSLLVTPSNVPVLLGKPALSTFSSSSGSVSAAQTVSVVGSDNPGSTTSPTITVGTPTVNWITATASGNSLTLTANPSNMSTGLYAGIVPVTSTAYSNGLNFPVVLVVNGGAAQSGPLTLSTSSIPFTNVTASTSQTLNVTATTATSFTASTSLQTCTGNNWLAISPSGSLSASSTNTPITVTVSPSGITSGTTCNGTISLATASTTQTVSVSMAVGVSGSGGNVTVTPATMSFAYTPGQAAPGSQSATILSASGTSGIGFAVSTSASWLTTNATSSQQTPFTLTVSVVPGSLAASTTPYQGTVTITPNGGAAMTISVSFTITAEPTVTATPTTINLSYQVGGTSPTGTISVSAGGATANFTAVAASTAGWLAVSPGSGTTATSGTNNLTVSLVPSVLATLLPNATGNPYTGTVTVSGTSPAIGTTIVNVSLNITAPLPTITGITNAASGVATTVEALAPGEIISIYANPANPIGPSTLVQLNSTTCPSPCTQVPTTMGGVTVTFQPIGVAAPLIFVSAGQINAIVPYQAAGIANLSVGVKYLGQTSNFFPVTLTGTAPGIFTANSQGTGQGAIAQVDAKGNPQGINSAANPAQRGWYILLYLTGEGVVTPAATTGGVTQVSATPPLTPVPVSGAPTVLIGNQPATVSWYGEAPGDVSGVLQVDVLVPQSVSSGPQTLSVSLGTASSQAGVTVAIQ